MDHSKIVEDVYSRVEKIVQRTPGGESADKKYFDDSFTFNRKQINLKLVNA